MMELIVQRTTFDCVVCTIAMATGRTYEEVWAAAIDQVSQGRGVRNEQKVFENLGYPYTFQNGEPTGDFVCRHRGILSPEFFRSFAWGRRAIMAVPSLNQDSFHSVYWDGLQLHDPSPLKKYTQWSELRPDELVLFRESFGR